MFSIRNLMGTWRGSRSLASQITSIRLWHLQILLGAQCGPRGPACSDTALLLGTSVKFDGSTVWRMKPHLIRNIGSAKDITQDHKVAPYGLARTRSHKAAQGRTRNCGTQANFRQAPARRNSSSAQGSTQGNSQLLTPSRHMAGRRRIAQGHTRLHKVAQGRDGRARMDWMPCLSWGKRSTTVWGDQTLSRRH